jgi:flagellar biogenesis protein FliO
VGIQENKTFIQLKLLKMKTFVKFILILIWTVTLMSSCSTVHKNITSTKKTVDSVAVVTKDTTNVAKVVAQKDDFTAKGVDITFNYGPDATIADTVTTKVAKLNTATGEDNDGDDFNQIIKDAIANYPASHSQIPSTITIHIDSITNSAQKVFSSDSSNLKETSTVNVKTNTDTKDKVISKSGLSFGTYAIVGLILVIIIAVYVIKKFIL